MHWQRTASSPFVTPSAPCNPEQRRGVWESGDRALLSGGRRFFDFAQNDIYYGLLRRHLFGHPLIEPGAGVAASLSNADGIFRGDVARLLGLTARIISKTSLIQV